MLNIGLDNSMSQSVSWLGIKKLETSKDSQQRYASLRVLKCPQCHNELN